MNRNITIRLSALVVIFLFCVLLLHAQAPSLTIGNVGVCNNSTVSVPLTGSNLTNIGAITLYIDFDPQSLSYDSVENINPQLSQLLANAPSASRVSLVWSKTSGASFMNNELLLKLKFTILKKSSTLIFVKENCEIANISLPPQVITINYTDGAIFPSEPTFTVEPENKTIPSQSNAVFLVTSSNASTYTWQESRTNGTLWSDLTETNTYNGTQTDTLTIRHVPANFNHFIYRCILNKTGCPAISSGAVLSVDSLSGIYGLSSQIIPDLKNTPNPFTGKTTLEYTVPEPGFVTLKIFSITGEVVEVLVERPQQAGVYRIDENFVYLTAGVYICQYVFKGPANVYETHRKMIKINQN